jgi:F-box and WD-40 domain protein 1/11
MRAGAAILQTGFQAATSGGQSPNNPYQNLITPAIAAQIQAYQQQLQQQLQQQTLQQQQLIATAASNMATALNSLPAAVPNAPNFAPYAHQPMPGPLSGAHNAPQTHSAQPLNPHSDVVDPPPTAMHQATLIPQPNARVFKLQFDARRIICCSQDPKIVGWDFANGDESIIKCSRFFASPQ